MSTTINPFTGQVFEIAADATEPLVIENFDPTKDSIQLAGNPDSEVIPQFSFSDRYTLSEINGDTAISTLTGELVAVVKGGTGLKTFTGYTEKGTYSLVSLENEFFSTYLEDTFFEPWYVEFDKSEYGNSVQKAIDAGLVDSAYEHYLKFGQFEAREDGLFAPKTDGNNTLYGSGYENGLVGVPISEGFYTRDVKPITTGIGEIDTLIGAPGEDTFFLGNAAMLNEKPQPFYVGEGDSDYALIKGFGQGSTFGADFEESPEPLTDRILLAGKPYDYEFEKVGDDLKISFQDDLIAMIEDAPPIDQHFYIPGGTYVYTTGNVATFEGWGSQNTLYEPFYFESNPGVEEAIANGEYASALDHLVKVGQFNPEGEVIFSGSAGDDSITGLGAASLLFGVEVTFVDGEQEGYRTATTGVGEADFAVGSFGVDTFVIGNDNILDPEKGEEVWYVGNGDEDYLTIQGFDPYKDFLFGAGDFADYTFEVLEDEVDGYPFQSLEVNYQGDRVALIKGIDGSLTLPDLTSLEAFPLGDERPNGLALVAPVNEAIEPEPPAGSEFWDEALYLATFPDLVEKVESGEYTSGLDYYTKVGQFEDGEDLTEGFFTGTPGNDIISGFGDDKDLYGVGYKEITTAEDGTVTLTPESLGVGEVDVLVGTEGFDGNYLVAYNNFNFETLIADTEQLYVGQGDKDYALVKNLDPSDGYITISSTDLTEFDYKVDGQGFKIYYNDDLVGIAEGIYDLQIGFFEPTLELAALSKTTDAGTATGGFDEDLYLLSTPDAAKAVADGVFRSGLEYYVEVGQYATNSEGEPGEGFFTGTNGNDFVIGFGANAGLSGVGITATDASAGSYTYDSLGVGEVDTLIGGSAENGFLLGTITNPGTPETKPFYVGKGDADYALIKNFKGGEVGKDQLILAGNPDDYTYETVDGNVEVSYQGDLISIVEGVDSLQVSGVFSDFGIFTLNTYPVEQFNADVYAAFNPDILAEIGEGKPYQDVLDYYVQKGQFREDGGGHGFFDGSSGNDVIQGFGFDKDLFGVSYTSVTGSVPNEVVLVPETLGVGEIDTLIGSTGIDGFYAAAFTKVDLTNFSGDAEALYIGEGDGDYALIQGFDTAKDYFALAGSPADYIYKVESNDFKVYTAEGDLVAIVEDTTDLTLKTENIYSDVNTFTFTGDEAGQGLGFDEEAYLGLYPEVAQLVAEGQFSSALEHYSKIGQYEEGGSIYSGTSGDDTVISWTQNAEVRLSGVDYIAAEPAGFEEGQNYLGIKPASYGVGEIDTLILDAGTGTISEALLGFFRGADGSMQRYYVGQGDEDYALVKNFNKNDLDEIFLAGAPEDYTYEDVDGSLHIAYDGDLVGIVEGVKYEELELADEGEGSGAFVLIGKSEISNLADPILGTAQNDTFTVGSGETLVGQAGSDRFFVQTGGDNFLTGGAGADQFWIANDRIPEAVNTITDFTLGEDAIGIAGLGASFSNLTLTQQGENTLIGLNGEDLALLSGIQASSLTAGNFAFA
jgi:Ca2+-binding RTX toxin-like protein